ncbi:hypothetical protein F5882DRAFT_405872 [Hyaloscypha sp. PMI_1271]|nr:hypothetical protein F5882DRAFT_405872 [Hyaloscypha sp. PMI_1271]
MQPKSSSASSGDEDSPTFSSRDSVLAHRSAPVARLPRMRKSVKRVKTGCQTCKVRRVKCDESKPGCQRCIRFGVVCGGYGPLVDVPRREPRLQTTRSKILLPTLASLQAVPIYRLNGGVGFEDELNGCCFRIYLEETARQMNGPFPNPIWANLIPQISEMEPFVRDGIIAIGALGKHSKSQLPRKVSGPSFQGDDYQYALKLYGRSLRGMRDAIARGARGKHELHNALIACLLVFVFEGMLGNQAAAAVHAECGMDLLFKSALNDLQSQAPPTYQHFEKDLLLALSNLDLQVLLFIDKRSKETHEQIKYFQTMIIGTLPAEFKDLQEARHFWQLIMSRNYHFLKSLQLDLDVLRDERLSTEGTSNMQADELLLRVPKECPMTKKEEHLRYRTDIGHWTLAAAHVFDEIAKGEDEREKAGAALLIAQTKISYIMLSGIFFTTETAHDVFLPEFIAIINLSEIILPYLTSAYRGGDPRFSTDIGIVAGIFLVASRCRFDHVRKRAIEMLLSCNLREGIWDALAVAHVATWLRSLELEGLAEGDPIPEEKRAVLSTITMDLHNRKVNLGAIQRAKTGVILRETSIAW